MMKKVNKEVEMQGVALMLGFKPILHFTVAGSYTLDLGRNRALNYGSIGTPNEMLYIIAYDRNDNRNITDAVSLHNYDYHGYMTRDKLTNIVNALKQGEREKK